MTPKYFSFSTRSLILYSNNLIEIVEWNAKLLACKPSINEHKLAPVMEEELRKEFVEFLNRVSASLRPAESTSHKTLLTKLQA